MERAERNGLSLQSHKGSTGLLFSVKILAPILDGGLRHIVLAVIQYSLGRHTYMPGIVAGIHLPEPEPSGRSYPFHRCGRDPRTFKPIWRTGSHILDCGTA